MAAPLRNEYQRKMARVSDLLRQRIARRLWAKPFYMPQGKIGQVFGLTVSGVRELLFRRALGIPCPTCSGLFSVVLQTKLAKGQITRKRRCDCGEEFRTEERIKEIKDGKPPSHLPSSLPTTGLGDGVEQALVQLPPGPGTDQT